MPRSIPFAIALGLLASTLTQAACSDDGEGQADFCGRLDVDCSLEVSECQDVLRGETIDHPGCDDIRQGLLECALDQALWSCPDSTTLHAGASYVSGGRQYNLQGYTMWAPATCDADGDAWERCVVCGPDDSRAPAEAPAGSYANSCHDCTISGSILSCDLCDGTNFGASQIDVCGCIGDIANKDGTLCCDAGCQD